MHVMMVFIHHNNKLHFCFIYNHLGQAKLLYFNFIFMNVNYFIGPYIFIKALIMCCEFYSDFTINLKVEFLQVELNCFYMFYM